MTILYTGHTTTALNADLDALKALIGRAVLRDTPDTISALMTFSGGLVGALTGNADTATRLATPRLINGVAFDGAADITVSGGGGVSDAGDLTGTTLAPNVVTSSLTSVGTLGSLAVTGAVTAGSFVGPLTGNVTGNVTGSSGSTTGNAATATKLATARTINGVPFDGSANITIATGGGVSDAGDLTGTTLAANVVHSSLTDVGTLTSLAVTGDVVAGGDVDANDFVLVGGAPGGGGGTAAEIEVSDHGSVLTSALTSLNFTGAGVTLSAVSGAVTVDITGAVTSVFGRTGAVVATSGDYTAAQVGAPSLSGVGATGTWPIAISGNAATAGALLTPRTIAGVYFDGTANIAIPFANLSSKPTTIAGYGITDYNSLGDARWVNVTGDTMTGALNGTTAAFSGEVDGEDFVLVGGVGGGGGGITSEVEVLDHGTSLTAALTSLNFTGAGVSLSATSGDVTVDITGAVTSVYGRTGAVVAASGDYTFAQLASKPTTIAGYGITDYNSLGDARWSALGHTHTFASLTSKPTTLSGYGITDAPTTTGTGASGTWGISISGNAATATSATSAASATTAGACSGNSATATSATTAGSCSGNAATATALQTARLIAGVSFNGSANIAIPYANLSSIPSSFTPSAHTHAATDITSGTLADARLSSNVPLKNVANTFTAAQTATDFILS